MGGPLSAFGRLFLFADQRGRLVLAPYELWQR